MSSFVGYVNLKNSFELDKNIIKKMKDTLSTDELDENNFYTDENICISQSKKIAENFYQIKEKYEAANFVICFNGNIYNTKELTNLLENNGIYSSKNSYAELLLNSYLCFGNDFIKYLNGAFSFVIWNRKKQELFLARDHFGIKPIFYTLKNNTLIFSTEIKSLLKYPGIETKIDEQGISEMFGIGPCHSPGTTVFKDIFEIMPAHFGIFNFSGLHFERYWKLISKNHTDSFDESCNKVKYLIEDSISNQIVSDKKICTFLSGGLDSSIISKYASDYFEKQKSGYLNTFSVDYLDNDKNFVKSDFQPNSDNYYIELMNNNLKSHHHKVVIDTPELALSLKDAMLARDMPGMADVDSSLLIFCKNVKKNANIALTGECADEIFGGYPWFFNKDLLNSSTFPWSTAINERQLLLSPEISKKINLMDYINYRYNESISNVELLDSDSSTTVKIRKISYLTLNWFMNTLLDRSERMALYNDFEIRVPFCDYRLVQYMWNIPWEWKSFNGREKGLLRYIVKDFLPEEIVERKKSPYPKTHNPTYLSKVKSMLTDILNNNNSPINNFLNHDYILDIIKTDGKSFTRPWFGQLMTGPQLMAYLIQVNQWFEKYNPQIVL